MYSWNVFLEYIPGKYFSKNPLKSLPRQCHTDAAKGCDRMGHMDDVLLDAFFLPL